jgi:PASTA domain
MTSVIVEWALLESGERPRSLVIQYHAQHGARRPVVHIEEDKRSIEITLRSELLERKPGTAWTPRLSTPILTVELQSAICGRAICGYAHRLQIPWPYLQVLRDAGLIISGVPRVVGLSPADAVEVLRYHGFDAVVSGFGDEVISQHPARGEVPSDWNAATPNRGGTVRLHTAAGIDGGS